MIAIEPNVFKPPLSLRFRTVSDGSDRQSECYLLCVDMWRANRGRIAIAPRVKLAYKLEDHRILRQQWSNATTFLPADDSIDWIDQPPALVRKFPFGKWGRDDYSSPFVD